METSQTPAMRKAKNSMDWRSLFRYFRSPVFLAHLAVILTSPYWMPVAVYLYFRSFDSEPNGFWAWLSIVAIPTWIVYRIVVAMAVTRPLHLELKAARKAVADGDRDCQKRLDLAKTRWKQNDALHTFGTAPSLLVLLIPPVVALMFWSTMQLPVGELVKGKLVIHSRSERLQTTLRSFEKRGVFTPLVK